MSSARIQAKKPTRAGKAFNPPATRSEEYVSFSYKYLETKNPKFGYQEKNNNYFNALIDRLRSLSMLTPTELRRNAGRGLRCHTVNWMDTTEACFGIPQEDEIVDTAWELQLSGNEYGRMFGFFIQSVFYIRWLDPDHNLYE